MKKNERKGGERKKKGEKEKIQGRFSLLFCFVKERGKRSKKRKEVGGRKGRGNNPFALFLRFFFLLEEKRKKKSPAPAKSPARYGVCEEKEGRKSGEMENLKKEREKEKKKGKGKKEE